MQYRTYKMKQLDEPYEWTLSTEDGGTATFVNYDTLIYAAGGAAALNGFTEKAESLWAYVLEYFC